MITNSVVVFEKTNKRNRNNDEWGYENKDRKRQTKSKTKQRDKQRGEKRNWD